MTRPVLVPVEVGSDDWHKARLSGITASEIAGVLGLAPDNWTSPFNLFWRKAGGVGETRDNAAMEWGRDLESVILRRFAREHPELVVKPSALYQHGDDPRWMATPDGIAFDETSWWERADAGTALAVVQAKTAGSREHWGEPGSDDIPVYYTAQVRWEMFVMDVSVAYVPVLFFGRTYHEYVVEQDPMDVDLMVKEATDFMRRLAENDPPDVDWRTATTEALKQLHPKVEDREVEVPATWRTQWQLADRLIKAATTRKQLAENRIRNRMGAAKYAVDEIGGKVASRSVYDMKQRTLPATTVNRLYVSKGKHGIGQ